MSIFIEQIHRIEDGSDRHSGIVRHNNHLLNVKLVGQYDRLVTLLQTETTAEYEFEEIISVEVGLMKDDEASGIFPSDDNQIIVDGTVLQEIEVNEIVSLFDVYMRNNADFITITSDDLTTTPVVDTRIRIVGMGLHVYPDFT